MKEGKVRSRIELITLLGIFVISLFAINVVPFIMELLEVFIFFKIKVFEALEVKKVPIAW